MPKLSGTKPPWTWDNPGITVHKLTELIAYTFDVHPDEPNPMFWHWCSKIDRWVLAGCGKHQLVSKDPLHLEPSLLWPCCGTHGFVRNGEWQPA